MRIILFILSLLTNYCVSYHYLIVNPIFGFSHVKFLSSIADVLADAGHNVTLLQYYHLPLKNIDQLVKNPSVRIIDYFPDGWDAIEKSGPDTMPGLWNSRSMGLLSYFRMPDFFVKKWGRTYSKLLKDADFLQTLENQHFDAVVAETFELGGFYIAHLIKAPAVIATMSSVRYPYTEQLFGQPATLGYIPGDFSRMGKKATVFDRLNDIYQELTFTSTHKAISDMQNRMFNNIVGYRLPNWKNLVSKSTFFITNTNSYLDFAIPKTANIIHIGGFPMNTSSKPKLPNEYEKLMGETTVIISFGSVVRSYEMPEHFKTGLVELFEEFPNVTFIWKYEKDDLEFKKRLGRNVHLKSWMPQAALLSDKRVKLFITHGGLASTMEVAYSGKPALMIPLFSDQFHNAMMLSRHGGAIAYNKDDLSNSKKLKTTVKELLKSPKYSENAQHLSYVLHNQPIDPKQTLITHMEFAAKFPNLKSLVPENNSNGFFAFYYLDAYFCSLAIFVFVLSLISYFFSFMLNSGKLKLE